MLVTFWFRFATYTLIIAVALWLFGKRKQRIDLYIGGMALWGILIDIIDQYFLHSNTELYAIYRVVSTALLFLILDHFRVKRWLLISLFGVILIASIGAFALDDWGWTNSALNYESKFGFVSTDESSDLKLLTNMLTLIPLFFALSNLLSRSTGYRSSNSIVLTTAFLLGISIDVYLNILVKFLYSHYETYIAVAGAALSTRFILQHALILFAMLWKRQ